MFILLTSFLFILCPAVQVLASEINLFSADHTGDPVKTIVIDAGHGGHDPGCLGADAQEKKITLQLALLLRDKIKSRFPDVKVVLTRDKDVFVPLHTRSEIANDAKADLFISLHCNALPPSSKEISGSETYVLGLHRAQDNFAVAQRENGAILLEDNHKLNYGDFDPSSAEAYILMTMYQNAYLDKSIVFADLVEKAIEQHGQRTSKGVKQAGFLVLRENAMPSVLVETGFLTNASDHRFLNSEEGQIRMAESLALAFADYKSLIETGETAQSVPATPAKPAVDKVEKVEKVAKAKASEPETNVVIPIKVVDQTQKDSPKPATGSIAKDTKGEWFGIQMGAFSQKLPADHIMRKDVHPLMERTEKGLVKYIAGPFSSQEAAEKVKNSLVQSGYKGIFTVAYRGEERIR